MKLMVPPSPVDITDSIPKSGPSTTVVNPKSARHAVTGLAFVIRILPCVT